MLYIRTRGCVWFLDIYMYEFWGLGIGDWGSGIGDRGLGIGDWGILWVFGILDCPDCHMLLVDCELHTFLIVTRASLV